MPRQDNIFVSTWDKIPGWGQFAIVGSALFFGGRAIKKQIDRASEAQRLRNMKKIFEEGKQTTVAIDQSGNVKPITVNTAVAAVTIYDAIYNNDPFGWTEDETRIIETLRKIPPAFIKDVEENYHKLYKKNLREDVIKALDADEWKQVEHLF